MSEIFTPYAASAIVNEALTGAGLKPIPSQMMYNYTYAKLNKGERPLIACSREQGIDREAFNAWLDKYLAKKGVKRAAKFDWLPDELLQEQDA